MKTKILLWTPRLLMILVIAFMVMMSADCFGEYVSLRDKWTCFFMHNIPAFALMLALLIAWLSKLTGGILLILMAVLASFFFRSYSGNPWSLIVVIPLLLSGILFILSSRSEAGSGSRTEE